jgi:hypothetical protein
MGCASLPICGARILAADPRGRDAHFDAFCVIEGCAKGDEKSLTESPIANIAGALIAVTQIRQYLGAPWIDARRI